MHVHSVPWDADTLVGYAAKVLYDVGGGIHFAFAHSIFVNQFILSFLHHRAFYRIFRQFIHKMDQSHNNRNRKQLLTQSVRFHIMAKK